VNLTTGSLVTRRLGAAALVALVVALAFGLYFSDPEIEQRDAVRLMYLHLPSILLAYLGFFITMVGSIIYLRNGSRFWDLLAGAAAEIGVVFAIFLIISGALWGKPTWGVYWQWEPRLTSTTVMFLMYVGYLALRRLDMPPEVRARRAAILGIVSFLNVIVVRYSVQWWRGLHQGQTLGVDTQIDGLMLFSLFLSAVAFLLIGAWLLIHRFRVAWLEHQVEQLTYERALAERRGDVGDGLIEEEVT
jgi:heme exporter protein C